MVAPSAVVKITAKTAMRGRYIKCMAAATVFVFAVFIMLYTFSLSQYVFGDAFFYGITAVSAVALVFPLMLGVLRFFHRLHNNAEDSVVSVFHYFSSKKLYFKAVRLTFMLLARYIVLELIFLIPVGITEILASEWLYNMLDISMPVFASNLWVLSNFFSVLGNIIVFFIMLKFYLAPFLFVADEDMDEAECVHMSCVIAKRTSLDFFFLVLSLMGWILLSVLVMPLLFTVPYFVSCYLVHCRFSVAQYNKVVDEYYDIENGEYSAEGI